MNKRHDRAEVLKSGMALFCKKGYNSLGVDEICKITGMTKGAFYNAFKSKEQFLLEAIKVYSDNNIVRIQRELIEKSNVSAFDTLKNFYIKMIELQPQNKFTGCFVNNVMSELGAENEKVGQFSTQEFKRFLDQIEPTVKKAQEQGDLNPNISTSDLTELFHATFYGALTIAKSSQSIAQGLNTMNLLFNSIKK